MAGGFRSLLGVWIGGVASFIGTPPVVLCPCPEYGHDQTLSNLFAHDTNQLTCTVSLEQTLAQSFTYAENPVSGTFGLEQTLGNNWKRKGCE